MRGGYFPSMKDIIEKLDAGRIGLLEAFAAAAESADFADIDFARLDLKRRERCGFPEFIYGAGKTEAQIAGILSALAGEGPVLVTRVEPSVAERLLEQFSNAEYDRLGKALLMNRQKTPTDAAAVLIVCAGTSDLPAAREAGLTLATCGFNAEYLSDVGVAGIERTLLHIDKLRSAEVIIVAAGMEGALPSVIGGLVSCPVIALPTSVGYGAGFGGAAALLGMLNSCASGVTVVNINNGLGAACAAVRILNSSIGGKINNKTTAD